MTTFNLGSVFPGFQATRESYRKLIVQSAKDLGKESALFSRFGRREAFNMDLLTVKEVFGVKAERFVRLLRQGKLEVA